VGRGEQDFEEEFTTGDQFMAAVSRGGDPRDTVGPGLASGGRRDEVEKMEP
jgi:hypothetical protein